MTKTHCKEYKGRKMLDTILRKISILRKGYQICFTFEYTHDILVNMVTLNAYLQLKLLHCTAAGETSPCAVHLVTYSNICEHCKGFSRTKISQKTSLEICMYTVMGHYSDLYI